MPEVGAAGPRRDNVVGQQFLGLCFPGLHGPRHLIAKAVADRFAGETIETKLLVGFCLAVRRGTLEKHGPLDEALYLGADNLEYSLLLREAGLRLLSCKDAFVHHVGSVSFSQINQAFKEGAVRESDLALLAKLMAYYGDLSWLISADLWGCDIFESVSQCFR